MIKLNDPPTPPADDTLLPGYIADRLVDSGVTEPNALAAVADIDPGFLRPAALYAYHGQAGAYEAQLMALQTRRLRFWQRFMLLVLAVTAVTFALAPLIPAGLATLLMTAVVASAFAVIVRVVAIERELRQ